MTVKRILTIGLWGLWLAAACSPGRDRAGGSPPDGGEPGDDGGPDARPPGSSGIVDPDPSIAFTQVGLAAGINRSNEPASAGRFDPTFAAAYGSWLVDLDGDGRLDYYAVHHSQAPHLSGLFLNTGAGGFGRNLFTVSVLGSNIDPPILYNSNEMRFVGDLTGDGKVDLFFLGWYGLGTHCVNQGVAAHSDWVGPSFVCYGTGDGLAFADVNGDGKIDVLSMPVVDSSVFDVYATYYAQTVPHFWRLNNGDPDINHWPIVMDTNFLSLPITDPGAAAADASFLDLNGDGIPDKIVGLPAPVNSRGPNDTLLAGHQVFLGQANRTYRMLSGTGLEGATGPITRIEDINGDGCLDIGTDVTGYRDNQSWYIQKRSGITCTVAFTATPGAALPFFPGFKHYAVDLDNSGLLSQVVLIHRGYGTNDGLPVGASIYRLLPDGSYLAIPPAQSGLNVVSGEVEFYADNLAPGDWNDDGRIDLGGTGDDGIPGTDLGFGLWTSKLSTTNSWIKIALPTVTGFFSGSATIEVFDAGFAGDANHLVTPPRVLFTGRAWASQVYHLGIGTRSAVDVRVTFPDGSRAIRAGVAPRSRLTIQPGQ